MKSTNQPTTATEDGMLPTKGDFNGVPPNCEINLEIY